MKNLSLIVAFIFISCQSKTAQWETLTLDENLSDWHIYQDNGTKSGWKAENFPALRRMIESALPGTKLLTHDNHLHLQRNIHAGADALNQGVKINKDWQEVWTMLNAGNGGGDTTNNYITTHDDHSQQTGGATLVAGGTDDRHTSNVQDTTMNPHWGVG